jgi:hypothetical protein
MRAQDDQQRILYLADDDKAYLRYAHRVPWRCIPELCVPELSVPKKNWMMRPWDYASLGLYAPVHRDNYNVDCSVLTLGFWL